MLMEGATNVMTWVVEQEHLASSFGSGLAAVLATPVLAGFCEECCRKMVDPDLPDGEQTVGTEIHIRHLAATPQGMKVIVRAVLRRTDGRSLHFDVEANDEVEKIAEGTHTRFIINSDRFSHRIKAKREKLGLV
ncbi:MAG TPA: thioesterase [Candidatus Acetothermia bacterium]|nr:thioesterase [Candidatus Acetothermia bacterium]